MDRIPWIKKSVRYGEYIRPWFLQKSNNHFRDSEIISSRTDPVTKSFATPLQGKENRSLIQESQGQHTSSPVSQSSMR